MFTLNKLIKIKRKRNTKKVFFFIYKEAEYRIVTSHIQMLAVFTERQQN